MNEYSIFGVLLAVIGLVKHIVDNKRKDKIISESEKEIKHLRRRKNQLEKLISKK